MIYQVTNTVTGATEFTPDIDESKLAIIRITHPEPFYEIREVQKATVKGKTLTTISRPLAPPPAEE